MKEEEKVGEFMAVGGREFLVVFLQFFWSRFHFNLCYFYFLFSSLQSAKDYYYYFQIKVR